MKTPILISTLAVLCLLPLDLVQANPSVEKCLDGIDERIRTEQAAGILDSSGGFTNHVDEKIIAGLGYPDLEASLLRKRKWFNFTAWTPLYSEWKTKIFSQATIASDSPRLGQLVAFKRTSEGVDKVEVGIVSQKTEHTHYLVIRPNKEPKTLNADEFNIVVVPQKYVAQEGPAYLVRTKGQSENYGLLTRVVTDEETKTQRLKGEKHRISLVGYEVQIESPGIKKLIGKVIHEDLNKIVVEQRDKTVKTLAYPEKKTGEMKIQPLVTSITAQKDHAHLFRNPKAIWDDELSLAENNGVVAGWVYIQSGETPVQVHLINQGTVKVFKSGFVMENSIGETKTAGNDSCWNLPSQDKIANLQLHQPYGSDVHSFFAVNP